MKLITGADLFPAELGILFLLQTSKMGQLNAFILLYI